MAKTLGIFALAIIFYAIIAIFLLVISGFGQPKDSELSDESFRHIMLMIGPVVPYLIAMIVYGVTAFFPKARSVVELAVKRMFQFHLGWFFLYFVIWWICYFVEMLTSYVTVLDFLRTYGYPFEFLSFAWPFLMVSIFVFVCASKAMSNDECASKTIGS